MTLDYLREPHVIPKVLRRGREITRCYASSTEDGGRPTSRGLQTSPRGWTRHRFPPELLEGVQPRRQPGASPVRLLWASDLQNRKIINLHCFNPLSWRLL